MRSPKISRWLKTRQRDISVPKFGRRISKLPNILKANNIYFWWKNHNIKFQSEKETQRFLLSKCRCAGRFSNGIRLTFVSTMCVNSYWLAFSNSCLYACTKWWLMLSPKACRPRLSSGTARSWLVMLFSLLVYYVASAANFERWLWALCFPLFNRLIVYIFFALYVASGGLSCVWIFFPRFFFPSFFSCFHNSLFLWFAQYCLS